MKRFVSKTLAVLFGSLLLVVAPVNTVADSTVQPNKEEVVYVKLLTDGSVDAGYIVNGFEVEQPASFMDYGDYQSVHNLSTLDPLTVVGDAVNINASQGAFYYQGDLKSTQLPWTIAIGYRLNGRPVTPQQTVGASGHLKIVLDISDNPSVDPGFAENYALQIEMTLDTQKCTDIAVSGATIATSGQDKVINFIRMPGGGASTQYSVSMTVSDFEMDGIRIVGIPFNISVDMPDTDELTRDLRLLQDGIGDVNGGARGLATGTDQLEDGYDQFHAGLVGMQTALSDINAGLKQMVGGNADLQGGLDQIEQALMAIQSSLDEYDLSAVDMGELIAGSAAVLEGINQLSAGLGELQQSFDTADQEIYEQSAHAYEGLQQANEGTILILSQQIEVLMADPQGNADQIEQLTMAVALLGANNELIKGLKTGINGDGTPENPGLAYAAGVLSAQYQQMDQAIEELPAVFEEMADGMAQLKAGIDQLVPNFSSLKSGLSEYLSGTLSIQLGFNDLCNAFGDVVAGSNDLKINITMLRQAMRELADGTGELYDETRDMDTQMKARIDEMLLKYTSGNFEVISFASTKNTNVVSVQFVMMTDAIKKQEAEAAPPAESVERTLWQRFLALFGWSDEP